MPQMFWTKLVVVVVVVAQKKKKKEEEEEEEEKSILYVVFQDKFNLPCFRDGELT